MGRTAIATLLLAFLAAAGPVRAQGVVEGTYRIEGRDALRRPYAGSLRVYRAGQELRYERRVRATLRDPIAVERGTVVAAQGSARTLEEPRGIDLGMLPHLGFGGNPAGGRGGSLAWRGLYRPVRGEQAWDGLRSRGDGQFASERLIAVPAAQFGNSLELLIDGEAFTSIRAAIGSARRTIDVQTFQWADDSTGRGIAELLMRRAREGLRVRCLVDGSSKTVNDLIESKDITAGLDAEMRAAGIEVLHHHGYASSLGGSLANLGRGIGDGFRRLFGRPVPPRERRGLWNHDHRKILVVDERVGYCGGMNIGREYEFDWHDVQARVDGPAGHELHRLFVDRWNAAGGRAAVEPAPFAPGAGDAPGDFPVEVLGSIPGTNSSIRDMFLREIRGARREIKIQVAYFLDDTVIAALIGKARSGVRTVVLVPEDDVNDVYLVKEAFAWVQNDVVRGGVELYKYRPRLNHGKLAIFDMERATVGSCNLDRAALELLAEANVFVPDRRFAREIDQRIFQVDLPQSNRARVRPLPWKRKIVSGTLHFFRGLL